MSIPVPSSLRSHVRGAPMLALLIPILGCLSAVAAPAAEAQASRRLPRAGDTLPSAAEDSVFALEERRYDARAMALRDQIVQAGSLRLMGTDDCDPGALRVFDDATDELSRARIDRAVWELERLILARGVGRSVADAPGRDLIATVMRWESGDVRPRWDADMAEPARAVPPGVMGEFPDPETGRCVRAREIDTMTFWVPALETMRLPGRGAGPIRKVYFGKDGLRYAREEFVGGHANDTAAYFEYVHIAPIIRWRDWAVVGVRRPAEKQAMVVGDRSVGSGGASYVFRRVRNEWRLVAIARSW